MDKVASRIRLLLSYGFKFRRKQNIVVHNFLLGLFFVLNNYFEMNRNWWILVIEIVFK